MGLKPSGLRGSFRNISQSGPPNSDIAQFESGSLHPSFTGDTGNYSVTTNAPTLTGSYSLKESTGSHAEIVSTSGLNAYPQAGQKISCYMYQGSGADTSPPSYMFGVQDINNYYLVQLINEIDELRLRKSSDGTATTLGENQPVAIDYDTWYDYEVEWYANGDIVVRLWSVNQSTGERQSMLTSFTRNDTEYTGGGIGFRDGSNSPGLHSYDNYRILEML